MEETRLALTTKQEEYKMTDTEKLDDIRKKLRKMEIESKIQVVVVILTFVGIISLPSLINKIKKSL